MGLLKYPFSSKLPHSPWFHGDLTREEAEQLLKGHIAGTFLIRFSKEPGCYAASFVGKNGESQNGLITKSLGGYQVNRQGMSFVSLEDLIKHYIDLGIFSQPYNPA